MTSVWGLSCNFSMTSNNEPSAYVVPNKQKILLCPSFFQFFAFSLSAEWFFCKHQSLKLGSHNEHWIRQEFVIYQQQKTNVQWAPDLTFLSSIIFSFRSFWSSSSGSYCTSPPFLSLGTFFFVMSSFSCETLYGELHLFFIIIIMLVLKRCLAQLSKLAELKIRRKKNQKVNHHQQQVQLAYNKSQDMRGEKEERK